MLLSVVVPVVHVIACVFLIIVVLLQTGKGADMGAVFGGGGSQTLFGATGAGNLLTKLTTAMAITFMITSLLLAMAHQERPGSDLIQRLPDVPAPVTPPPAAEGAAAIDVTPKAPAPAEATAPVEENAPVAVDETAANDDSPSDAAPPAADPPSEEPAATP